MSEFLRKMIISAVITGCILFGFISACRAYSGIRKIGFGEYVSTIEVTKEGISFFDYTFSFNKNN